MDIHKILTELRAERERVEEAILALERLAARGGKRRGRPPAWLKQAQETPRQQGQRRRRTREAV